MVARRKGCAKSSSRPWYTTWHGNILPVRQVQNLLKTLLTTVQLAAELTNIADRLVHLNISPPKVQSATFRSSARLHQAAARCSEGLATALASPPAPSHTCCPPVAACAAARTSSSVNSSIVM